MHNQRTGRAACLLAGAPHRNKAPDWFWQKHLILTLCELKGMPLAFEAAVKRGQTLEAHMGLQPLLKGFLQIGFLIEKQYFPWWEKHQEWAFKKLPLAAEILPMIQAMASLPDWSARVDTMHTVIGAYTQRILDDELLPEGVLEDLFAAKGEKAWCNPQWQEPNRKLAEKAQRAGCSPQDGWLWALWPED